jgi:hypothetical protein
VRRNTPGNTINDIAMRIDQSESVAEFQILQRHSLQKRLFTRPRFADDVHVRKAVFGLDAKGTTGPTKIRSSEVDRFHALDCACARAGRVGRQF